jgi:hypothetical protein
MRSDMKKVVVERPRWGSRGRNRKFGARLRYIEGHDYDEQPKKALGFESYRSAKYAEKEFTDVLNPLERFLRSNLGRPWDKVNSELCAGLDKRKTTGLHIFQHLKHMVKTDCCFGEDGQLYSFSYGRGYPIWGFYVHPRTGLLREMRRPSKRERNRELMADLDSVTRLFLDNNVGYQKHEGIWYRVKLMRMVVGFDDPIVQVQDIFLKRKIRLNWGENWIAVEKKQCNREELKTVKRLLESGKGRNPGS